MPKRIAVTKLNASTMDILNTIRQNASYEYQSQVPEVTKDSDIPRVGEILYGYPALANQFINALVNRIALVRVKSAVFNNAYAQLKKGYLEFGETVEEVFVEITKAREFSVEKAADRELKRSLPDVRTAFHAMNWRVQYPVTIQDEDLKLAFLSIDGVTDLISKIVDAVYTAAEYDEFLLFKYLLIKSISHGKMKPISIGAGTDIKESAIQFRGISNKLPFMSSEYNEAGVTNNTPKDRQVIFMDAMYNAQYDVEVLASAFNMDKADFMGRLFLIDDWTTFDMDRFEVIMAESDGIEPITPEELALLSDVKAVMLDDKWFQVYDNNNKFTEKYVASGLYWNYFYHVWKTISYSPFANAVVFVSNSSTITPPATFSVEIAGKDKSSVATVLTLAVNDSDETLQHTTLNFVQSEDLVKAGIAVQKYGAVIIPASATSKNITLKAVVDGVGYTATTTISDASNVGDTVTLSKNE